MKRVLNVLTLKSVPKLGLAATDLCSKCKYDVPLFLDGVFLIYNWL